LAGAEKHRFSHKIILKRVDFECRGDSLAALLESIARGQRESSPQVQENASAETKKLLI
jgi:hypothetical protein